ncbi:MAG: acyl-ACP thioesterase [Desulfovibrio sp.]|jgi:acyl-ACP thioesterase|nr:acyl-ACP thioesterase [Desulfovibrio sp.]
MNTHTEIFLTRLHEMDVDHLLRVQCICNYMEEAAGRHAELLGVGLERLDRDALAWVLAKMRLSLSRRPGPGERILIETWPVKLERLQFRRDFIIRGDNGDILATAVTQWVVMGLESRKLERFPLYIAAMAPENPPLAQECGDIRIPALPAEGAVQGPLFPVRLADIDQNRHVNNGRYVDFVLEAADCRGATGSLAELEILFRSEGKRGDVIGSRSKAGDEPGVLTHSLYRESDGQELARARTVHGQQF